MKLTVANLKGGTAKTITSFFLATAFARRGRTLLVDCDPQGSALCPGHRGRRRTALLYPSPLSGFPVRDVPRRLKPIAVDYDHMILDTPPVEYPIVRSALIAADAALVAVPPTGVDLDRVIPTLELVADVEDMTGLRFHVLLTRVKRISKEGQNTREVMMEMELPLMQTEIPLLNFYSDAFGTVIEKVGDYEAVAAEILGEEVKA